MSGGVQLHVAFAAIAAAYIVGVALANTGNRLAMTTQ